MAEEVHWKLISRLDLSKPEKLYYFGEVNRHFLIEHFDS